MATPSTTTTTTTSAGHKPKLRVRQMRSTIGCTETMRATIRGLGLRGPHSEVIVPNQPSFRGMVKKVLHLVDVEECDG